MDKAFDVVIVGAGLVGAALALALREARVSVALVDPALDASDASAPAVADDWDSRIYAISPSSVRLLAAIGAWPLPTPERAQACERMVVYGDAAGSALEFDAWQSGETALAWMVESRSLAASLAAARGHASHVTAIRARPVGFERNAARVRIVLDDGSAIDAALAVGADGARSWLRDAAVMDHRHLPYGEQGVVANFAIERSHDGTAFQWFRGDGVLAWLPLPGRRMSMVWSCKDDEAEALLALPPRDLCDRVAAAGRDGLGRLDLLTPARAFPLARVVVPRLVSERVALVGDAAHVVHPLAGQGVNLGFGDVAALAEVLARREVFRECGDGRLLRRYERSRREDILAMRSVTHGLDRLFAAPGAAPRWLRNTGLDLVGRLPGLKGLLARHALG
jgi:ubiquinone biosynthesis UbiH/UbiF/VisC/COQ6 family hydroxylase